MSKTPAKPTTIMAFGAHPDDIEFGAGGVIAQATRQGHSAHFVIGSRGEAGSFGTPEVRTDEAQRAAEILKATIDFIELDGDAHLEVRASHAIKLAAILRRVRPELVLAPTLAENQHPDHFRLGQLVRDATRLARYGGLGELRGQPPHVTQQLLYYAVSLDAEPRDISPVYIDVSAPEVIADWKASMEAHASQINARGYVDMQLTRARMNGMRAGVGHAIPLFPNDPPVFESLTVFSRRGDRF